MPFSRVKLLGAQVNGKNLVTETITETDDQGKHATNNTKIFRIGKLVYAQHTPETGANVIRYVAQKKSQATTTKHL